MSAVPPPPPLPNPPALDPWRGAQWLTLLALINAVYPSIKAEERTKKDDYQTCCRVAQYRLDEAYESVVRLMGAHAPSQVDFDAYLADCPSLNPAFGLCLRRAVEALGPGRRHLEALLCILSTRTGSLLLTGCWTPFWRLPLQTREQTLRAWQSSRLSRLRLAARWIPSLASWAHLQTNPLFLRLSGYPDGGPDPASQDGGHGDGKDEADDVPYSFLPFPPPYGNNDSRDVDADADETAPIQLDADVVVVGSGCGGAVCAKVLAEAGRRVIVLDKGYHFSRTQFPMTQETGSHHLFERHGYLLSDDKSTALVAGSCWGGGGTVNWGVCLPTPGRVRCEWASRMADPFFASPAFQACLDRVTAIAGASTSGLRHNPRNKILADGCRRLGLACLSAPINSAGADHYCGRCQLGCPSGRKRGPAVNWLVAAARAGARFVEGVHIHRVLFATAPGGRRRAAGVQGVWTARPDAAQPSRTRPFIVTAKKVILACGALWSPILLRNSGLKNPHIGAHLHVHPCCIVGGYYNQDMKPWEGCSITTYSPGLENLDQAGYGVILEPTCMVPYSIFTSLPWHNGLDHKLATLKYRHLAAFIALTRDRDSGHVYADRNTGLPRVSYTPSAHDRAHGLQGAATLAKICHATGAAEVRVFMPTTTASPSLPGGSFDYDPVWTSAHQMSSCRMAAAAADGVVDVRGRVWGVDALFVADASVLPSAPGVNPMLTIMAVADWIARAVEDEFAGVVDSN